jgi:hypothetical protein
MSETWTAAVGTESEPFPLGAHVVTPRRWYTHHGIYVGAGQVVHYEGLSSSMRRGPIAKTSLAEFGHGHPVHLHDEVHGPYSGIEVAARACSRLGEDAYDVLRNNCEHFCSWCLIGTAHSVQAERLLSGGGLLALAVEAMAPLLSAWPAPHATRPLVH